MIDKKIEEAAKGYAKEKEKICKKIAQKTFFKLSDKRGEE